MDDSTAISVSGGLDESDVNINSIAEFVVVGSQFGEIVLAHGNDPALEFFRSA